MVRELPPELAEVAKIELNENPKTLQDDLQHLKHWISKQPHLKARSDDQWLVSLIRGSKFSLERVKQKLDLYYTLRTTAPDVTLRIKPTDPKFIEFLKIGTVIILPRAKELLTPRFILLRPGLYNPNTHHVLDVICTLYFLTQVDLMAITIFVEIENMQEKMLPLIEDDMERKTGQVRVGLAQEGFHTIINKNGKKIISVILVLEDDVVTVVGTQIITDYKGVSLAHTGQASPAIFKKIMAVLQDSQLIRLKGNHHVNLPPAVEALFGVISVFLNKKAIQRRKIHKNNEDLLQHVPREVVPSDYGGDAGTCADIIESWVEKVKEYHSWFEKEERLGTDESKRLGKPRTAADMFDIEGTQGSFRKLDID